METKIYSEWATLKIETVFNEIKKANGKVKDVLEYGNMIKIMSKLGNCIRYDIISPTDNVTYRVPHILATDIDTFIV
jgi:hypothetical protein